jgi:hypothetical protein
MTDVPLSLAVISTVTPVVAGALPLAVGWIRGAGRERADIAEHAGALAGPAADQPLLEPAVGGLRERLG